jgi:repressor LexA
LLYRGAVPSLRDISRHLGYRSRRSASLLLNRLVRAGYLERSAAGRIRLTDLTENGHDYAELTVEIPLLDANLIELPLLANGNIRATVLVSQKLAPPGFSYFLIRPSDNSMTQAGLSAGTLALVRQHNQADDGDRIVVILDGAIIIRELRRHANKCLLVARSEDKSFGPIILPDRFAVQGIVVDSVPYPEECAAQCDATDF